MQFTQRFGAPTGKIKCKKESVQYLSVFWNQALEDKVDSEGGVGEDHWSFDVIRDELAAGAPVLENHKGLELRKSRLSSVWLGYCVSNHLCFC